MSAYAAIRRTSNGTGRPIDANDLLIAAHVVALGCTLITDNERDFRRIQDLPMENWLRRRR